MNIGVLGGSFNPVHNGHIALARRVKEEFKLDKVIFMPAGNPYQKKGVLPIECRLGILRKALGEEFEISEYECSDTKPSYSCDTFEALKKEYPTVTFYFILGYDCLDNLGSWRNPGKLLANCEIIAATREGTPIEKIRETADELESRYNGKIHIMEFEDIRISSTLIRERIKENKTVKGLVPEGTEEMICRYYGE